MKSKTNSNNTALIVEDYKMDADAPVSLLIEAGYQKNNIHISETKEDAEQYLKKNIPELIILDIEIPRTKGAPKLLSNGLLLLRWLVKKYDNKVKVIAFSRYPFLWVVYQVLSQGVSFITKEDYSKEFFLSALEQVKAGHLVVSSSVIPVLQKVFVSAVRVGLEEDDKKILELILNGKTDKEIALNLKFSDEWVANRLRRMFRAFGFRSREDLAAWYRDYVAPIHGIEIEEIQDDR